MTRRVPAWGPLLWLLLGCSQGHRNPCPAGLHPSQAEDLCVASLDAAVDSVSVDDGGQRPGRLIKDVGPAVPMTPDTGDLLPVDSGDVAEPDSGMTPNVGTDGGSKPCECTSCDINPGQCGGASLSPELIMVVVSPLLL